MSNCYSAQSALVAARDEGSLNVDVVVAFVPHVLANDDVSANFSVICDER